MAPRKTRPKKPPCKHCPEAKNPVQVIPIPAEAKAASVTIPVYASVVEADAARAWKWVCYGTGTVIGTIEGYTQFGMPHAPIEDVQALRDRLDTVLQSLRSRPDAVPDQPAEQRRSPDGSDHGDAPDPAADGLHAGRLAQDGAAEPA